MVGLPLLAGVESRAESRFADVVPGGLDQQAAREACDMCLCPTPAAARFCVASGSIRAYNRVPDGGRDICYTKRLAGCAASATKDHVALNRLARRFTTLHDPVSAAGGARV